MNKVLVKVYIPIIEEHYDILIPVNRRIHSIIRLLIKSIYDLSGGYYNPNKLPLLYDKLTAKPYDLNQTVKEANIVNGKEIVLI